MNQSDIKPCVNCGSRADHYPESDGQANAIYCSECPLGVEWSNMDDNELLAIWNGIYEKVNKIPVRSCKDNAVFGYVPDGGFATGEMNIYIAEKDVGKPVFIGNNYECILK